MGGGKGGKGERDKDEEKGTKKKKVGRRRTIQVVQIALYIITTNFQRCKAAPESFTVSCGGYGNHHPSPRDKARTSVRRLTGTTSPVSSE